MRALVADAAAPGRIAFRNVPEPVPAHGEVLVDVLRAGDSNRSSPAWVLELAMASGRAASVGRL